MSKVILRDAEVKDLSNMVRLNSKLIEFEETISDVKLIENKEQRIRELTESLSRALINPNFKILVVDNNHYIKGIFVAYIEDIPKIFLRNKVCNVCIGYCSKKGEIYIKRVQREIAEWAKSKGCTLARIYTEVKNDRVKQLLEKLDFKNTFNVYEKELI
jgi:hypothetical protein